MRKLIELFVNFFIRGLLSLRYRVVLEGLEKLETLDQKKGLLILVNHPAYIDGPLLLSHLWPKYRARPIVADYVFNIFFVNPIAHLLKTVPIPNFEREVTHHKVDLAQEAMRTVTEGLKNGETFLFYPAGRLRKTNHEVIGGASGVQTLLKACPETAIALVRVTGLWGSIFSRAIVGQNPHVPLPPLIFKGFWYGLKNAIFFSPRRTVKFTFSTDTKTLPRKGSRLEINRWLEKWYNQYTDKKLQEEPVTRVSHSFWTPNDLSKVHPDTLKTKSSTSHSYSKEVQDQVVSALKEMVDSTVTDIHLTSSLSQDLGLDSLDVITLATQLVKHKSLEELHVEKLFLVQDLCALLTNQK